MPDIPALAQENALIDMLIGVLEREREGKGDDLFGTIVDDWLESPEG